MTNLSNFFFDLIFQTSILQQNPSEMCLWHIFFDSDLGGMSKSNFGFSA